MRAPTTVVSEVLDGEAILLSLDRARYFRLNGAGTEAWSVLAAGGSVDEAVAAITQRFDVEPDVARRDVNELTTRLLSEGLLEE